MTSSGQIAKGDNLNDAVTAISFKASPTNGGIVSWGRSDVSASNGDQLEAGEGVTIDLEGGSVLFSTFFANVPKGNRLNWVIVMVN